jgi:hypothetical protein
VNFAVIGHFLLGVYEMIDIFLHKGKTYDNYAKTVVTWVTRCLGFVHPWPVENS